jgi:hypothetical protein
VLEYALVGLQCVFVVIDAQYLGNNFELQEFVNLLQGFIARKHDTVIKIAVFGHQKGYGKHCSPPATKGPALHAISLDRLLSSSSRPKVAPGTMKAMLRRPTARGFQRQLHQRTAGSEFQHKVGKRIST